MIIILAFPGLVLGILMHLSGFRSSREPKPSEQLQWRFILRVLMLNYAMLYLIAMIYDLTDDKALNYLGMPFLLYPVLFMVFAAVFAFAWRKELVAGSLLVLWYLILLFGTVVYTLFSHQGPWILVGVVILVQGIFYLYYYFRYRRTQPTV